MGIVNQSQAVKRPCLTSPNAALTIPTKLAADDGALGFWKALKLKQDLASDRPTTMLG